MSKINLIVQNPPKTLQELSRISGSCFDDLLIRCNDNPKFSTPTSIWVFIPIKQIYIDKIVKTKKRVDTK